MTRVAVAIAILPIDGLLTSNPRDNVTFNPFIFYLTYWTTAQPANLSSYFKLPLLSCAILQSALLQKESISHDNRVVIEEMTNAMHNSIIEPLSNAIKSSGGDSAIYAIRLAMWSVYTDLTKSKHASEDEAELLEACKPCLLLLELSSLRLVIDEY